MQWTHEQSPIIQSEAPKLLIQAGAGSGKTTTLMGYAQHHSRLRILYLCYNKSVEIAARGRFSRNVISKTAHGLAFAVYGTQFSHKQTNNLRLTDIARAINTQDWELVRDVVTTLNNFMASADDRIERCHIHRTVIGVIENALCLVTEKPNFYWVGGIDSYSVRDLEDLFNFSRQQRDLVQNKKLLRDYRDYAQYVEIAEVSQDSEMLRSIKIINMYPDLPQRILALRTCTVDKELDATISLTSAHKAKGLEWDFVELFDDFTADPLAPDIDSGRRDDELNLLYVAVTRAMKILAINSLVLSIMGRYVDALAPEPPQIRG